jgi:hypothetical protein
MLEGIAHVRAVPHAVVSTSDESGYLVTAAGGISSFVARYLRLLDDLAANARIVFKRAGNA